MDIIAKYHQPLLFLDKSTLLTYHHGYICKIDIQTRISENVCPLPISPLKKFFSYFRIVERFLRIEVRASVKLPDNSILFSFNGSLYHLDLNKKTLTREFHFRNGMRGPLAITRIEGIEGFDDCTVFGEYIPNTNRNYDIAIYGRKDSIGEWSQCYLFKKGEVKHIHNIVADPTKQKVYVLTGDNDEESGIWEVFPRFSAINPVLTGSQQYRAVSMFFVDKGLLYATDSALDQNNVYLIGGEDNGLGLKEICKLSGSCIYGAETQHYAVFATTVEPDERLRGLRLWLSCKPGPSINDEMARLVVVNKRDLKYRVIFDCEKDKLPYILFRYGSYRILGIPETDNLIVYPIGVRKLDGKLLKIEIQ